MKISLIFTAISGISALQASAQTFSVSSVKVRVIRATALAQAERATNGVKYGSDKKTISVYGKSGRLVIRTGPKSDMMSFRIHGLRNPTIFVAPGSKLRILFVNADDDMLHSLRFTTSAPPFDAKVGTTMNSGSDDLPHMKNDTFFGQELVVVAPTKKGSYAYLCTVLGHASAGMFGKLVVR